MRFDIPETLIPKLRDLQSQQNYPDEILESEDAVVMTLGLGPAMCLAFDGRVIVHDYMDDERPRQSSDPKEAFSAIVIGAKVRKAPELLSLLLQRPANALDCADCEGSGWRQFGKDVEGKPIEVVCRGCGGTGWVRRS